MCPRRFDRNLAEPFGAALKGIVGRARCARRPGRRPGPTMGGRPAAWPAESLGRPRRPLAEGLQPPIARPVRRMKAAAGNHEIAARMLADERVGGYDRASGIDDERRPADALQSLDGADPLRERKPPPIYAGMNASVRRRALPLEADLFAAPSGLPEGFRYEAEILSADEEEALARELGALPFKPFDFRGFLANRQAFATTTAAAQSSRRRRFRPSSNRCGARPARSSAGRRRPFSRFSSTNISPAPESAGIATRPSSTRSSAFRCLRPALCASAERLARVGSEPRSMSSRARPTFCRGRPAGRGSTAFRLSTAFAIRSPSGRSLRKSAANRSRRPAQARLTSVGDRAPRPCRRTEACRRACSRCACRPCRPPPSCRRNPSSADRSSRRCQA